jgi:hypothetical protein
MRRPNLHASRLAAGLTAVLSLCLAATAHPAVRVDTLYAVSPALGANAEWQNTGAVSGPPPSNCNTNVNTPYAYNDNDASTEYLAFGTWRLGSGDSLTLQPGYAVSRVQVDVDGRYDSLSTGDRFGLRVMGTAQQADTLTAPYNQAGFLCLWQFGGGGWDVTARHAGAWQAGDVQGLIVAARRYPGSDPVPPNRARIGAFRIIVTSTDERPLPPGATLTMVFATGEGGHAGSSDITVNIGTVSVANGHALFGSGHVLQVELRYAPTPGPNPIARTIHLSVDALGNPPLGFGGCAAGGSTMVLEGPGKESVLAIDYRGVPRNVALDGTVRIEMTDSGSSDRVRVYFTPDNADPDLWAAVSGLVFDVPITRGGITTLGCSTADVPPGARYDAAIPDELYFAAPAPNPALGMTTLSFGLPRAGRVSLDVYDLGGRRVANLLDGVLAAGRYSRAWDGPGRDGVRSPAGLYFVRLVTDEGARTRRLTLIR